MARNHHYVEGGDDNGIKGMPAKMQASIAAKSSSSIKAANGGYLATVAAFPGGVVLMPVMPI